jgi:subtilase family serine protease
MKKLTKGVTGSILAGAISCVLGTHAAEAATTQGNVARWVTSAKAIGEAPSTQTMTIAVHLKLTNLTGLKQFVAAVSSPASKQYGQFLSPDEFAQRYAPAAADTAAVKSLLEKAGMTNAVVGPHGVYVSATATVAQLKSAFNITQSLYSYNGKTLRANNEEATIPASLAGKIAYIEGLDDTGLLRTPYHLSAMTGKLVPATAHADALASTAGSTVTPPPVAAALPSPYCNTHFGSGEIAATLSTPADVYGASIPWLNCGYTPQQIQIAYGLNQVGKFNGAGVTVAIVDAYASPTLLADSNRYAAKHGLPKLTTGVNFSQIIPAGIYDVPPADVVTAQGWWTEQSLDMAAVHGSAPGASILYVGASDPGTSLTIALANVLYNHLADVATNSYGFNGEAVGSALQSMYDQAFIAGAALGTTVLFSSGDDGDLAFINGVASGSFPATSAYVTGVGGTSLLLNASGTKSEYGWGTYRDYLADATVNSAKSVTTSGLETTTAYGYEFDAFAFYSGSGGGISLIEPQPAYQATAVPAVLSTTLNLASGYTETLPAPERVSPDVAMVADPYTGYLYGETFTIAGNPISDAGCTPISSTEEYCEQAEGGTSLASPLMAGVIAVIDSKRKATGGAPVGFANPLLYSYGSGGNGTSFESAGLNQVIAPTEPVSVLRGYQGDPTRIRVITINSVPFNISTAPYALEVCGYTICEGLNDVWNFTSLSSAAYPPTGPGYNDVTGLGVPYVPKLIQDK